MKKHAPRFAPDAPRFVGLGTYARLPHVSTTESADFGIVGVPFDLGCSFRPGPRFGPAAVREASRLMRLAHAVHRIDIYEHLSGVDYGDTPLFPSDIEGSLRSIEKFVAEIVATGATPLCIGGDHTIPLPILRATAKKTGPLALVHFDAHSDTDDVVFGTKFNHGTTFRRALEERLIDPKRSIQLGIRGPVNSVDEVDEARDLGFEVVEAHQMFELTATEIAARIRHRVGEHRAYLTFDIDFLDPAFAPGTGTPEVGGPSTREALAILRGLTGIDFAGFDLVEVSPPFDTGNITALAAANIIFEFIALLALRKRAGTGERR
jgi:agmatinase